MPPQPSSSDPDQPSAKQALAVTAKRLYCPPAAFTGSFLADVGSLEAGAETHILGADVVPLPGPLVPGQLLAMYLCVKVSAASSRLIPELMIDPTVRLLTEAEHLRQPAKSHQTTVFLHGEAAHPSAPVAAQPFTVAGVQWHAYPLRCRLPVLPPALCHSHARFTISFRPPEPTGEALQLQAPHLVAWSYRSPAFSVEYAIQLRNPLVVTGRHCPAVGYSLVFSYPLDTPAALQSPHLGLLVEDVTWVTEGDPGGAHTQEKPVACSAFRLLPGDQWALLLPLRGEGAGHQGCCHYRWSREGEDASPVRWTFWTPPTASPVDSPPPEPPWRVVEAPQTGVLEQPLTVWLTASAEHSFSLREDPSWECITTSIQQEAFRAGHRSALILRPRRVGLLAWPSLHCTDLPESRWPLITTPCLVTAAK